MLLPHQCGVIFDLDGTLVASEPLYFASTEQILAPLGRSLNELTPEEKARIPGRSAVENMAWMQQKFGLEGTPEGLMAKRMEWIIAMVEEQGVPLISGAMEFLQDLRSTGFRLALASSSPYHYVRRVLEKTRLSEFFQVIKSGDHCSRFKPDPEIFLLASEELGVRPERCIVFEDSHAGILAAHAANMKVIGIENEITLPDQIKLADKVIKDYNEISSLAIIFMLEGD